MTRDPDCVFCEIVAGRAAADVVYDDARVIAFMDLNPATDGHVLVVPRSHVRGILELADDDAAAVMQAAARVARGINAALQPDGFSLFQSNEEAGGQDVFHLHLHVVPRWLDDPLVEPWGRQVATGDRHAIADRVRSAILVRERDLPPMHRDVDSRPAP